MKEKINLVIILVIGLFGFMKINSVINDQINSDSLMQTIKEKEDNYLVLPSDARIENDTIIPGKSGKKVNINSSYHNMKSIGVFNDNFLVFEKVKPNTKLKNNLDKYIISGNKDKREVSLVFDIDNRYIEDILRILKNTLVNANFLVDGLWGENNSELLSKVSSNHQLLNKGYNNKFDDITLLYTNSLIDRYSDNNIYCVLEEKNREVINLCKSRKMGTILVEKLEFKDYTKIDLENGKIIYLNINSDNIKQLTLLIKYIKQKGYKMVTLDELLIE